MPYPHRNRTESLQAATAWAIGAAWGLILVLSGLYIMTQRHDDLALFLGLR